MKKTDLRDVCIGLVLGTVICGCASQRWPELTPWRVVPVPQDATEDTPEVVVEPVTPTPPEPEPVPAPVVEEEPDDYDGIRVKSTSVAVDGELHKWVRKDPPPVCKVDGVVMPMLARGTNGTTVWASKKGAKKITWWRGDVIQWTWPLSEAVTLEDHLVDGSLDGWINE